jgi:hypothetical protein
MLTALSSGLCCRSLLLLLLLLGSVLCPTPVLLPCHRTLLPVVNS